MILLDASVLIGHVEPADAHHAKATALLTAYLTDSFAASVITLAEVYAGAARADQAQRLSAILGQLRVAELALPAGAALQLGELRAATNLKMPDCCVLYTAEQYAAAIATFDAKLAGRAENMGIAVIGGDDV